MLIRQFIQFVTLSVFTLLTHIPNAQSAPYHGTIFFDADVITASDPSLYTNISYQGRGNRSVYDRRFGNTNINAYLFKIKFSDGQTIVAQVNPEFGSRNAARNEAVRYGRHVGQMPISLRDALERIIIHKGDHPWSGWNNWILIHTGKAPEYLKLGIVEETIIHETVHATLDRYHQNTANWKQAQKSDGGFISDYSAKFPKREDLAETYLTWLAVKVRADRISRKDFNTISKTIPNRIRYLNKQNFDLSPLISPSTN